MRRYLQFTPRQVAAMAWHERRMWLEGIAWEIRKFKDDETAYELDDFSAMGFTVRKV